MVESERERDLIADKKSVFNVRVIEIEKKPHIGQVECVFNVRVREREGPHSRQEECV